MVSTYIFVHDQKILLGCDMLGKFKQLPDVHYVFLGANPTDEIQGRDDVIIARNLPNNIEQYPKFCAFTGWYVLWKNNLIKSEYVHLLEYDTIIQDSFNEVTEHLMEKQYSFIGYIPLSMRHAFINHPQYLANIIPAIKRIYDVDIIEMVTSLKKQGHQWSSTSNSTFSNESFIEYMNWFEKLIDDLKDSDMSGHAHERSITFFNIIFKKNIFLTNGLIKHLMSNVSNYQ